jgi:glycosyltransferase involved in cell wall biosynthesis
MRSRMCPETPIRSKADLGVRRVLMIAFHYPPLRGSSGIQRTLSFSRHLREHGWQPIVMSAHPRAYQSTGDDQLRDIPADVIVHRPFALDASRHLAVRGAYPKLLALPDRWSSWCLGAVPSGLAIVRRWRPQVLWSTYPIATAHVIGLCLHALTGIPWVADFRDSMTEPDYPPDRTVRGVYRRIERSTIRHAARTVFTTPGTRRMYAERYREVPSTRWAVIANGYDEEPFLEVERGTTSHPAGGPPAVLVHSGLLYPSERDPRAFFSALAALRKEGTISPATLRVVLRGSGYDDFYRAKLREEGIDDIVRLEPQIGYREALAEMLSADGLLLFQASNCNHQIPAKIYEYLRSRRPIFAMTDAAGDTARVLADAGVGTVVPLDSQSQIAEGLLRFLRSAGDATTPLAGSEDVAQYSRRSRAGELADLLNAVARG